ncbi:MAG: MerR family transcriptional regulator [Spirochaetaceae bacterium]
MQRLSISDVCDLLTVKPHVLRYWERQVGLLQPAKSASGRREYSMRDLELLFRLKYLLFERKFTLDGAVQKLIEEAAGERANAKGSLQGIRTTLLEAARHLRISAARALEIDADGHVDAAVLDWLTARPESAFSPSAPQPYHAAAESRDPATGPRGATPGSPDPTARHAGAAAPEVRAVVSLSPNWNISPEESAILEPLCVPGLTHGSFGGAPTPLELTAEKVLRLAAAARVGPEWIIAVPARNSTVVKSYLAEREYFGLPATTVSVLALPDLAPTAAVGPPGGRQGSRIIADAGPAYTSPMAALCGSIASGGVNLNLSTGVLLWMPLEAPFEEQPPESVFALHRRLGAEVTALVWERPGSPRTSPRLVPTGTMLMNAASVMGILKRLRVRRLPLQRNLIPSGARDVISRGQTADQQRERSAHPAGLYVGIPEILAAADRGAVVARPGGPLRFVRSRDEARRPV